MRTGRTGAWPACSRPPNCGSMPVSRTSTTAIPGDWRRPAWRLWPVATGSARHTTCASPAPPAAARPGSPAAGQPSLPPGAVGALPAPARPVRAAAHAHGDGSWPRLMNRLLKMDLLILDDWGLQKITGPAAGPDGGHRGPARSAIDPHRQPATHRALARLHRGHPCHSRCYSTVRTASSCVASRCASSPSS